MAAWPSLHRLSSTSCRTRRGKRPRGSFTPSKRSSPTRASRRCDTRASSRSRISSMPCGGPGVARPSSSTRSSSQSSATRCGARAAGRAGARAPLDSGYFRRIEAIEFAVRYDDGIGGGLDEADVVLFGVSRTSKTPLSMYLGNLGYKTANVPIVAGIEPPRDLFRINPVKVVGLTIDANRLGEIRTARARNFGGTARQYSELVKIYEELAQAEVVHRRLGCPVIDVSELSIEETAQRVIRTVEQRTRDLQEVQA